jgi:hypothetical protein
MFPLGTRPTPPPRLPRPVPPFPGETTASYLYRLAIANQVHPDDLRVHLAGTRLRVPITLDALASATGRPRHALAWALPELRPGAVPRADPVLPGHARRKACLRCAARRDAFPHATIWRPAEVSTCPSHRIWLGSAAHPHHGAQYDISDLPEMLQAQQRHYRLARRHGREAVLGVLAEAAHITALWARHGRYPSRRTPLIQALRGNVPLTGKLPTSDPATAAATYPETINLARILILPRWRSHARIGDYPQFQHEVRSCTGIWYDQNDSRYDPLLFWFHKHLAPA